MFNALQEDLATLREETARLEESGRAYAKAEAEYQSVKARRALELRANGESAAMVNLIIKGDADVNWYLMERECAKAIYEANKDNINTLKVAIRVEENQIQREYQG